MDLMVTIFGILGLILCGLTIYGTIKLKRRYFLFGLYLYSLLPIIGESMFYLKDYDLAHLLIILIFVVQLILASPFTNPYDSFSSAQSKFLTAKIGSALFIINISLMILIVISKLELPLIFAFYHLIFAVCIQILLYKRKILKGINWQ